MVAIMVDKTIINIVMIPIIENSGILVEGWEWLKMQGYLLVKE